MATKYIRLLLVLITIGTACRQNSTDKNILVSFVDTAKDEYGYKNLKGDTIIPLGKYSMCFTDTFKNYAIVALHNKGFVAIDKQEKILYNVFPFDNGPDYVADGMFRILIDGKIGYADSATGKIVIAPLFDCAWPFENGVAKVSTDCKIESNKEHATWLSDHWYYINRAGKQVNPPDTIHSNNQ
jgi:hypothetical protein